MKLDVTRIKTEVERPSKAKEIHEARVQQERIRFHADTNLDVVSSSSLTRFKTFVGSLLPKDKFEITMNLLKFPIPTNEVVDEIFIKLAKVFDSRNPALNYQFMSTEDRDDWEWYRQEVLGEPEIWSNEAWDYFKTEINCVMVVDMPEEGKSSTDDKHVQPYFYFVPIDSVISYEVNRRTKNMEWIIFRSENKIIAIDGERYYRFSTTDSGQLNKLEAKSDHGLPYCPARFFWSEPLSLSNPDVKKSPLSKVLSDLDWYLFFLLSKKHLELYGAYPIYSAYEQECDYSDKDGNSCDHGFLKGLDGSYLTDELGNPKKCPLCGAKKSLAGPGSYVEVPVPHDGEKDLRNPVNVLTIDKDSLEYNVAELDRLKTKIISTCVGTDNSILNETSLADKQVDASFESQDRVLNRIKKGFESAQEWVDKTICILRYGRNFLSAHVNYGTEFYTLTTEVLRKRYADAKASGASDSELDALNQQILETEYRHNPTLLQRMIILSELEPFRHLTKNEVLNMFNGKVVSRSELALKIDFAGYIRKFERENGNIIEFGTALPFDKKIETIYQTLINYADKKLESVEPSEAQQE